MNTWKWMKHPSWNNGEPLPVRIIVDDGVTFYQPFNFDAADFEWELRSDDWNEVVAPTYKEKE